MSEAARQAGGQQRAQERARPRRRECQPDGGARQMQVAPVPMGATGAEALKRVWQVLLRAFPDIHVAVEETITEGDKVVSRNTVTGTHRGEYQGLPPTGKTVTYNEIFIFRFTDGRITEIRGVVDVLAQLRRLGVFPS
ncbi:ester cyclase [Streptomyces sp. HUAS TT20]|uniref:ester cyclase n=1 Tax=Streptomyces sp. HUAS TT20 TaxID=3447509 RepID=UPI0021D8B68D|nr:ester cyclase [Streptomyces sp. HUAS 15-9]UXY25378.1 ester cyclase [Streptomyces sp. HUAS 15-9]